VDTDEPLPRLLRLRGMVARSVPEEDVKATDAYGLTESYLRLRASARSVATDLGISGEGFDAELPEIASVPPESSLQGPRDLIDTRHNETTKASHAASLLKQLAGYVEGLIEAVVLDQRLDMEQVRAAREAARQPLGFR
jgi:hypothetical protein